jgi:hypothetical protein
VRLLDIEDRPMANRVVNFDVSSGALLATSVTTDADGNATVQWRLPRRLRSEWAGSYENAQLIFRTQMPGGHTASEFDAQIITAAPAVTLALYGAVWDGSQLRSVGISGTWQAPLNMPVLIYADAFDEYGNRRDQGGITLLVNGQPSFTSSTWIGERFYRILNRFEGSPQTLTFSASDGAVSASVQVAFSATP